jgi:hypothetical protein
MMTDGDDGCDGERCGMVIDTMMTMRSNDDARADPEGSMIR